MFFRSKPDTSQSSSELEAVIDQSLPNADDDTRRIVTAVAGLMGCVSYADRRFTDKERHIVRNLLQTIHGVGASQADAILDALERHIITISTTSASRYARTLKELGDHAMRLHVLDMMLDVAAVDHDISNEEVVFLRQVTQSLGLDQADYNELQSKHRSLLAALQGDTPSLE